ncbi:hypothetical protein THAOC_24763, partial [Thalassiosira oceanica]
MAQTPYLTNDSGDGEMMPDDDSDDDVTYAPNDDEDDCDIEDEDWEADDEEQNKALDPSSTTTTSDASYKELYKEFTPFPLFPSSSSFPSSITAAGMQHLNAKSAEMYMAKKPAPHAAPCPANTLTYRTFRLTVDMAYLLGPLDMGLLSTLVRIVGLSGRAFGADPSDGGAEGAEADAPRAVTASSDVSYGVDGNPVIAPALSSPSSTHEATAQSSPAGASFGRRDPDPASPSSSFSQYEDSEQASRNDEEMATMILPTRPFAVPNPYATHSHKQPNPIRAERRPTPKPTRPTLEQIRRSDSNGL